MDAQARVDLNMLDEDRWTQTAVTAFGTGLQSLESTHLVHTKINKSTRIHQLGE